MATISLSPAQHALGITANRRIPLGEVPNAANSPYRGAPPKRSHDQLGAQEEFPWDLQPHPKRQATEADRLIRRTSPRRQGSTIVESRVFGKRTTNSQPTAFERQLLAAKHDPSQQRVERPKKSTQQTIEGVKQWQEHYKRAFPKFVFYFENIPEDVRIKCSKYARNLGAREEKFFSKDVTHVITLREVPLEGNPGDASCSATPSSLSASLQHTSRTRTINPSLLDQSGEQYAQSTQSRGKFSFDAATSRRGLFNVRETEQRKPGTNSDILLKAKEMNMKVWQLEKFQRMIKTMLEIPDENAAQIQQTRTKPAVATSKGSREAELSRMLRNERLNGPSDRDSTVAENELTTFKGPYIYIRDMDERTKPVMVRDYSKPFSGEMGEWPQFQGVSAGRCPFVPEITKEDIEKAQVREEEASNQRQANARPAPCTRSAVHREDARVRRVEEDPRRTALQETKDAVNVPRLPPPSPMKAPALCPPPPIVADKALNHVQVQNAAYTQPTQKLFGGEPAASGLQQSNITSAIRSQMISSTAAAPGAKSGTNKEIFGLKRKVLEKNVSAPGVNGHPLRHQSLDPAAVARAERAIPASRQTRQQAQRNVVQVRPDDDSTQSDEDENVWLAEGARKTMVNSKKQAPGKKGRVIVKPGYCENCREKYDDFDEHVIGRKHRKFAHTEENWQDLDRLLRELGRACRPMEPPPTHYYSALNWPS